MQALRVLHVTPYMGAAWAYGGIPRVVDACAYGLAARGHRVTVCTTDACDRDRRLSTPYAYRPPHGAPPATEPGAVELRVFPNVSNRLAYRQAFMPVGLGAYLRRHAGDFDIAHLHACRNAPGVIAARHLRAAAVPYVVAPNGTAANIERRRAMKRVFDALVGTRMLDGAARMLAVTEAESRDLQAMGIDAERIGIVPNPVALDEFDPPLQRGLWRQRLGIRGPIVAYLGTLTPRKRVDMLVAAFAGLGRADATLVVAGNDMGSGGAVRAAIERSGVGTRAVLVGLLEGRTRLELLADADVVVYPSEHEVFGLVPLEALVAGTPVVVANDSGCGEVIAAMGGGLVVAGDPGALAAAIAHILDAPDHWRAAAGLAARRVRATFAAAAVCGQLEQVYREVVDACRA